MHAVHVKSSELTTRSRSNVSDATFQDTSENSMGRKLPLRRRNARGAADLVSTWCRVTWPRGYSVVGCKVLDRSPAWWCPTTCCTCCVSCHVLCRGTLTQHDSVIFHDNDFEVFVDPDRSSHFYKEFEMNVLNTTWSLCLNKPYDNGGYENSSRVFGPHG